jgi:hypothetical protein
MKPIDLKHLAKAKALSRAAELLVADRKAGFTHEDAEIDAAYGYQVKILYKMLTQRSDYFAGLYAENGT